LREVGDLGGEAGPALLGEVLCRRRVDLGDRHCGAGDPAAGEDGVKLVVTAAQLPGEAGLPQLLEAAVHRGLPGPEFGGHLGLADVDGAVVRVLEGQEDIEHAPGGQGDVHEGEHPQGVASEHNWLVGRGARYVSGAHEGLLVDVVWL
jgi:hypothetical protein